MGARFNLPQKTPNSYASIGFCVWHIIANLVPGYNRNNTCIKKIKALYQAKKGSKNTRLKRMNEFLEAELEVGQAKTADISGYGEEIAEESRPKCSGGMIMKRTRS